MFPSYLIIHKNPEVRKKYISQFLNQFSIHSIDISSYQELSITISNIRTFQLWLHNKPYASKYKAAIIMADNLTREASQAMLKILEEPPKQNLIILESVNKDMLLPTIISRCRIINLAPTPFNLTNEETEESMVFWTNILQEKIGQRLKNTQKVALDREYFKNWINKQIIFFRQELLNFYLNKNYKSKFLINNIFIILKNLNKSLQFNENNISLKLNADHLFLHCFETNFHV